MDRVSRRQLKKRLAEDARLDAEIAKKARARAAAAKAEAETPENRRKARLKADLEWIQRGRWKE
jgi:hypothetical protein